MKRIRVPCDGWRVIKFAFWPVQVVEDHSTEDKKAKAVLEIKESDDLPLAELLNNEFTLEEIIYQLARILFTQSLNQGIRFTRIKSTRLAIRLTRTRSFHSGTQQAIRRRRKPFRNSLISSRKNPAKASCRLNCRRKFWVRIGSTVVMKCAHAKPISPFPLTDVDVLLMSLFDAMGDQKNGAAGLAKMAVDLQKKRSLHDTQH